MTPTLRADLEVILLLLFATAMQECQRAAALVEDGTLSKDVTERQLADNLAGPLRDAVRDMLRAYLRDRMRGLTS